MENLHVSVIMPVRDRFDLALIALRSVLNQTAMPDQLIVVDDCSVIPAEDALCEIKQFAELSGVNILYLRNSQSLGASAARNIGAQKATGNVLLFCDSDDFWVPQKVAVIKDALQRNSGIRVLVHSFYWVGGRLLINRFVPFAKLILLPKWSLYVFGCLTPSCLCIRLEAYGDGFDEKFRYHEDLEFALRILRQENLWFLNYPLTVFGRPPFADGGMTANIIDFRLGAIEAIQRYPGRGLSYLLGKFKILYHKWKIFNTQHRNGQT